MVKCEINQMRKRHGVWLVSSCNVMTIYWFMYSNPNYLTVQIPYHSGIFLLPEIPFCYWILSMVANICYYIKILMSSPVPLCIIYNMFTFQSSVEMVISLSRSRASQQARKSQPLMGQTLLSSGRGLYNSRPSRAIRAGQQENGWSAWSPR